MAPLLQSLNQQPQIQSIVAVTAQHREMLDQVLQLFDIHPDYDLNLMKHGQTLEDITAAVLQGLAPIMEAEKPDLVLVHRRHYYRLWRHRCQHIITIFLAGM